MLPPLLISTFLHRHQSNQTTVYANDRAAHTCDVN